MPLKLAGVPSYIKLQAVKLYLHLQFNSCSCQTVFITIQMFMGDFHTRNKVVAYYDGCTLHFIEDVIVFKIIFPKMI